MTEPPSVNELSDLCDNIKDQIDGRFFVLLIATEHNLVVTGICPKDIAKVVIKEAFVESTRHI